MHLRREQELSEMQSAKAEVDSKIVDQVSQLEVVAGQIRDSRYGKLDVEASNAELRNTLELQTQTLQTITANLRHEDELAEEL